MANGVLIFNNEVTSETTNFEIESLSSTTSAFAYRTEGFFLFEESQAESRAELQAELQRRGGASTDNDWEQVNISSDLIGSTIHAITFSIESQPSTDNRDLGQFNATVETFPLGRNALPTF
jgi:hypothetical protein